MPPERVRSWVQGGKAMGELLMIQADKCTGRRNCELACSMTNEGSFRLSATREPKLPAASAGSSDSKRLTVVRRTEAASLRLITATESSMDVTLDATTGRYRGNSIHRHASS